MAPPPKLTVSQWADAKRYLSGKTDAEPGPWRTDRNPLFREIMDCCSDPLVREVTFVGAAQVGKTESMINSVVGYYADQDPSPILAIFEKEDKMEAWSRERLMPMIMATPCLRGKFDTERGPSSGNKISYKDFPGGFLAVANGGSEGDLSSRPVRIVLKDELDKWKMLKAGDPDVLADERTATFLTRRKIINLSTPRDHYPPDAVSRIWTKYESSDMRSPHLPCPFCGHYQVARHEQIKYTPPPAGSTTVTDAWYECENPACAIKVIRPVHFPAMRARGRWIAAKPFHGHAGFGNYHKLNSPWFDILDYCSKYEQAKRQKDSLKSFVNEKMGLPWTPEMEADERKASPYLNRRQDYALVPEGAYVLVAAVDIQADRIECEVKAYGEDRRSFGMDFRIFEGKPHLLTDGKKSLPPVWQMLDSYLQQSWTHENGTVMTLDCVLIDQGFLQDEVQKFCKPRSSRNIRPCKGMSTPAHELVGRAKKNNRMRVKYFPIGTNRAKSIIFSNLAIDEPGPGHMTWNTSSGFGEIYFKQLILSEKVVGRKDGVEIYDKIYPSARNEALDLNVYALAAYELVRMLVPSRMAEFAEKKKKAEAPEKPEQPKRPQTAMRRGWITGWKR